MVQPLDGAPRHRLERGRGSKNKSKTPGRDSEEESDQDAGNKPGKKPDKKSVRFLKDAVFVVVAAIILSFLIKTFLIQSFYIPSESMEPTLEELDRVLVTKLAPGLFDVHRGDIVVFEKPTDWAVPTDSSLSKPGGLVGSIRKAAEAIGLAPADSKDFLIKRVIGTAGDTVACLGDGSPVTVNGFPLDETYVAAGAAASDTPFSIVVPKDAVWVMGDNRAHSGDSRAHQNQALGGSVALDNVVGIAQVRTWPLDRFALLRNPGQVFAAVPPPDGGAN